MSKNVSKILKPPGELRREIIIRGDSNGVITVEAWDYTPAVRRGFRPEVVKTPMDSRQMVLACQKVVMDYCAVMFANGIGGPPEGNNPDGTKGNSNGNAA